jgi:Ca2+:H+ antiporter
MPKALKNLNLTDALSLGSFLVFLLVALVFEKSDMTFLLAAIALAVCVTTSVQHADTIALKVGPSLGTVILAVSVTVIEVALIVGLMANNSGSAATIARDTVFSAVMIVTNGIIGICILLGGLRQKELNFQSVGTTALLGVLSVLSILTLVLPNFTTSTAGPTFGVKQLIYISIVSVFLYAALVWAQTKTHKIFFELAPHDEKKTLLAHHLAPTNARAWISFLGLLISLVSVVGFAKVLSPVIEQSVRAIGAPGTVVGVVIALLVLAPETLAAVKAARYNQLQTSLNLALGSGAASIALTIPCVSLYSIISGTGLTLGLDPKGMTFLVMTFIAASFTFGAGTTTALHGIVHLTIMASYVALAFLP